MTSKNIDTISWGESYKINLHTCTPKDTSKIKCSWCHQLPQEGTVMLSVPYEFVPSFIQEHVYAPDCINMVNTLTIYKNTVADSTESKQQKQKPLKSYYYKRDVVNDNADIDDKRFVKMGYFKTAKFVCSFNCMKSKAKELSERDTRFKNSYMLIVKMYCMIFNTTPDKVDIVDMPHYELFQDYGGVMSRSDVKADLKLLNSGQYYETIVSRNSDVLCSTSLSTS